MHLCPLECLRDTCAGRQRCDTRCTQPWGPSPSRDSGARGALAAAPQAPPGPAHGPPAAPPPANHHHSLSKKAEFSGSTALLSFRVAEVGNAAGRQVRGVGRVDTATAVVGQRAGAAWHRPLPLSPTLLASVHHHNNNNNSRPSLSTCRKLSSPRVCEYTHCYTLTTTTSSHLTFTMLTTRLHLYTSSSHPNGIQSSPSSQS
ncbi:hypothetical protein Pcinc_043140 [Petrolisthes cinctipes]|uniref:Uncharacterized protein n=1 Tax=Petrolisthes cinctipes TaxID=88211 RepID=A0AAE1BJQ7_PETCI|nr:hypothetical protein Pcinc_043140 [Petrolisthes cinctipes]